MNPRRLLAFALLLFAFLGLAKAGHDIFRDVSRREDASILLSDGQDSLDPGEFSLYFFEGNTPCSVCDQIRGMTKELFKDQTGPLARFSLREINVETPGNEKYVLDLGLYSTSVVLALESGGKIIRWKNLEDVWDLAGDREAFREYITREVESFVGGDKQ